MTRYVLFKGSLFDLCDGSLMTDHPTEVRDGHRIWSAEALLCALETITEPAVIKPFRFLNVIE